MSKMKPRKAATKRITTTGSGKLKHRKVGLTHLQTKRSSRTQMSNPNGALDVSQSNVKATKRLLGMA
jgi:ribosomal protein L35